MAKRRKGREPQRPQDLSLDPKIPKTGWNTTATKAKGQEATKATKAKTTKAKGQVAKEPKGRGPAG